MELAQKQFMLHPGLKDIKGVVAASGEAKWTVETALEFKKFGSYYCIILDDS